MHEHVFDLCSRWASRQWIWITTAATVVAGEASGSTCRWKGAGRGCWCPCWRPWRTSASTSWTPTSPAATTPPSASRRSDQVRASTRLQVEAWMSKRFAKRCCRPSANASTMTMSNRLLVGRIQRRVWKKPDELCHYIIGPWSASCLAKEFDRQVKDSFLSFLSTVNTTSSLVTL